LDLFEKEIHGRVIKESVNSLFLFGWKIRLFWSRFRLRGRKKNLRVLLRMIIFL
jgi:hypothetical protein